MQFSAYVNFEAADDQAAAEMVSGWGLAPGTSVTLTPVSAPVMGTVDSDGALRADVPPVPPAQDEPVATPKKAAKK